MDSLSNVSGVGSKSILLLNKLNIYNVYDLVTYFPKKYLFIKRSDMSNAINGDKVIVDGVVEGQPTIINISTKLKKVIFRISNNSGIYNITAFNQVYLQKQLKFGMDVIIMGKYDKYRNTIVMSDIRYGRLGNSIRIESIYNSINGLSKNIITKYINSALLMDYSCYDYIPDYLCFKYKFMNKRDAINIIHNPSNILSLKKARQRIKYEELFLYLLKINYLKYINNNDDKAIVRKFKDIDVDKFINSLEFKLTEDQISVVNVIKDELRNSKRMNRLIQGDVGSGKTIVAMISGYMNYLGGYQTALMVPTEILANQHYEDAVKLFNDYGVKCCLLTSSVSKKEKENLYKDIKEGHIDFIIGTQSLIQDCVVYSNLGLIITDEQHRFGVKQRETLKNKGIFPDVISMSATPIPRTYALTLYGDMDVSSIKTKPIGRKDVITYYKNNKDIMDVLRLMKKEIDKGHQIYVIAPSIDGSENDIDNVNSLKKKMEIAFGKICKISSVHGKMNNDEKNKVMEDFENGKSNILISTTVIEVGVNVVNASMIVIFNANVFGLSTLHQLRGRVGRGSIQSYCILISHEYQDRLKMLEKCNDGFYISEYDFINRGEGDLFGIKQSGDAVFKIANIKKDYKMLLKVREDIDEFMIKLFNDERYKYIIDYLNDCNNLS